ncbi:MAG: DUF1629 domain-containing protein [Pseudomonadota bacterium]
MLPLITLGQFNINGTYPGLVEQIAPHAPEIDQTLPHWEQRVEYTRFTQRIKKPDQAFEDYELPKVYRFVDRTKKIGDIFMAASGVFIVSAKAKAIIETHAKDRALLWPIEVKNPREDVEGDFFGLYIPTHLNAFDDKNTPREAYTRSQPSGFVQSNYPDNKNIGKFRLLPDVYEGHALWWDSEIPATEFFVSDALFEELKAASLTLPKAAKVK